jgi:BirA family biotin operon repressor/biotin-[acetyl-CoA-carboxylase] ligase
MTDRSSGWRLEVHDSLPSTSDLCIARAEAGEPAGLAVLARQQTRGRGSRGRSWTEPPAGNLALSVLLRPERDLEQPGLWPFVAGLALHQALCGAEIAAAAAVGPLRLKWPNDVMLDGRKLAGILIERSIGTNADPRSDAQWLVIGFGANLAAAPVLPDREAASLADLGPPPHPDDVARRVLAALDHWQAVWRVDGFAAIRLAWLACAHPVGTMLAVRTHAAQKAGIFAGIASDGALLLSVGERQERIDAGEILLLNGS